MDGLQFWTVLDVRRGGCLVFIPCVAALGQPPAVLPDTGGIYNCIGRHTAEPAKRIK